MSGIDIGELEMVLLPRELEHEDACDPLNEDEADKTLGIFSDSFRWKRYFNRLLIPPLIVNLKRYIPRVLNDKT